MRIIPGLIAAALVLVAPVGAFADSVVTLCQVDDEKGAGKNFTQAVHDGGRVTFACSSATIRITHPHEVAFPTIIDGGGQIKFQQLALNPRSTPARVGLRHRTYQGAQVRWRGVPRQYRVRAKII